MVGPLINTVEHAIQFLEDIGLKVVGIQAGWLLYGVDQHNDDFELWCENNAELIDWARSERDVCSRICEDLDLTNIKELRRFWNSCSPKVVVRQACLAEWMPPLEEQQCKEVTK